MFELQGLPRSTFTEATSINNAGQVVGESQVGNVIYAVEWSNGNVINLGSLPGAGTNLPLSINDAGKAVGYTYIGSSAFTTATEWDDGSAINLGGFPLLRLARPSASTTLARRLDLAEAPSCRLRRLHPSSPSPPPGQ